MRSGAHLGSISAPFWVPRWARMGSDSDFSVGMPLVGMSKIIKKTLCFSMFFALRVSPMGQNFGSKPVQHLCRNQRLSMLLLGSRFGIIFCNLGGHLGRRRASKRASSEAFPCPKGPVVLSTAASFSFTWLETPPGLPRDPPGSVPGLSGDPPKTLLGVSWTSPGSNFGTDLGLEYIKIYLHTY